MILVTWRFPGKPEESREYPDERLQELLDRAWKAFGDPDAPPFMNTSREKEPGLQPTPKPQRKR